MQAKVEICGVNTSELPVYSGAQTDALLRRAAAGDRGARDELIRGNLRLVLSVASATGASRRTICFRSAASV